MQFVNAPTELALYTRDASQVHRMRRMTPEDAHVHLRTGDELLAYLREGLKCGPVLVDDGTRSYLLTEDLGEIGFALMDPHRKKHQMRVAPPEWFTGEFSLLWMILRVSSLLHLTNQMKLELFHDLALNGDTRGRLVERFRFFETGVLFFGYVKHLFPATETRRQSLSLFEFPQSHPPPHQAHIQNSWCESQQ